MSKKLVIVESPTKAKTISSYLGQDYAVEASVGHIRDLPQKGQAIDIENNFEPKWEVKNKEQVSKLRKLLKTADSLYLATDLDREGEAISVHLFQEFRNEINKNSIPVYRLRTPEITKRGIQAAINDAVPWAANEDSSEIPEEVKPVFEAYLARRILDRLYGFELSPVLWRMISKGLSAGRVQSVATRLVVEREQERMRFGSAEYWELKGTLITKDAETFSSSLIEINGKRVATSKNFDENGEVTTDQVVVLNKTETEKITNDFTGSLLKVSSVTKKPLTRRPMPPFITSTFQQAASSRLKMSPSIAMNAASSLFQKGYITYMRTDSTTLSADALSAVKIAIKEKFGDGYLSDTPRSYKGKVLNAQEAHEAIRPAGERFKSPEEVEGEVSPAEAKVYEMIWQRTIASQMNDFVGETTQILLKAKDEKEPELIFSASGTVVIHQGFRQIWLQNTNEENEDESEKILPDLQEGDEVTINEITSTGKETKPPNRFSEATLIRELEDLGIGRPSTFASTVKTIQDRDYVWKKGSALVPTLAAFAVTELLKKHFPRLIDFDFTKNMETDLDAIAEGEVNWQDMLSDFYFGASDGEDSGIHDKVTNRLGDIDGKAISTIPLGKHPTTGEPVDASYGKFGPYVRTGDITRSIPDDIPPDELTVEKAIEFLDAPTERYLDDDPETGLPVVVKSGRFGPYVSLGRPPEPLKRSPELLALSALGLHRKEIKVALNYLRLAHGSIDEKTIRQIINIPKREGLGKGTLDKIGDFGIESNKDFLSALENADEAGIKGKALESIKKFLRVKKKLEKLFPEGPAVVVEAALTSSLRKELVAKDENRSENLDALIEALQGFSTEEISGVDAVTNVIDQLESLKSVEDGPKPKMASLFQTMTPERITFEEALEILSLPRTVGIDPQDQGTITVHNGRFGPYLRKELPSSEEDSENSGSVDTRSLDNEEMLLTITLEECLILLSQPKKFGRRGPKPPLAQYGKDPESGKEITLREGKFGLYVSDGEYNASLRRGDSPETLTEGRAQELLAERRLQGPAKKKKSR
tara:strand:+ start:969 stop:4106 length:3138 start_codon:yes stop_codon:yes gene_type:complete